MIGWLVLFGLVCLVLARRRSPRLPVPTPPPARPDCLLDLTISRYVDGGLTQAETTAANLHLAECPRCLSILASSSRALHDLAADPDVRERDALAEVSSRIQRGMAPTWPFRLPVREPALSQLRREIAEGATHDCGEWRVEGRCQLCDRVVWR